MLVFRIPLQEVKVCVAAKELCIFRCVASVAHFFIFRRVEMFVAKDFAKRLKVLRKKAGINQAEIADVLNIERSTYAYYESGKTTPSFNTLLNICKIHSVTTNWLLTGVATNETEAKLNTIISDSVKVEKEIIDILKQKLE